MRQVPSIREDYLYFEQLNTRWRDNDVYGHMNNAVFYEYADTVVNGWLIKAVYVFGSWLSWLALSYYSRSCVRK